MFVSKLLETENIDCKAEIYWSKNPKLVLKVTIFHHKSHKIETENSLLWLGFSVGSCWWIEGNFKSMFLLIKSKTWESQNREQERIYNEKKRFPNTQTGA